MPELPEVETIKRGLSTKIISKIITDVEVLYPKSFWGKKEVVLNQKVLDVKRRAKVIAIILKNGYSLLFHLKMTGQLIYRDQTSQIAGGHPSDDWYTDLPNKTTAIVFTFNDQSKLFFNDMRKFGWCKVLPQKELEEVFENDYGPEPFSKDFNASYLQKIAKKTPNKKIKQFLTDQKNVAGIGNIYVDELLYDAKILPTRKVLEVTDIEWRGIVESAKKVLELGIKYGGTTDSDYLNVEGKKGEMQNYLKVYRQTGKSCPKGECKAKITRTVVGGRGTHYCPACQK